MPGPAFLAELSSLRKDKRQAVLTHTHPAYDATVKAWSLLLDAYDGTGGFLDGSHLWRYPRETDSAYARRQEQSRYHNYAETLVDLYCRKVFSQTVERETSDAALAAWWQDVDGNGTTIDTYMRDAAALALSLGHVGTLVDKTPDQPAGPAVRDERARVVLARFLPQAILDWRTLGEEVTLVKLEEAVSYHTLVVPDEEDRTRYLIWARDGWARIDLAGDIVTVSPDTFTLGRVPLVVTRPKRSQRWDFIGKSIFNAGVLRALYNRASEEDQVLRDQAFSVFTVEVPVDGDVETAKKDLGEEIGTTRALFVKGAAKFVTPDMAAPAEIRANQEYLIREIYRMAHVRYERQSLDAQSAESLRLQFDELNEMLAGVAAELQRSEEAIARLYYAWMTPTPEQADAAYELAQVRIVYPTEFFVGDLETDLVAWAQAAALQLGKTATAQIKLKAVARLLPDLDQETLDAVQAEIEQGAAAEVSGETAGTLARTLRRSAMARLSGLMDTGAGGQPAGEGEA